MAPSPTTEPLPESRLLVTDRHLCVIDKPPGVLSQDVPGRASATVLARLACLLRERGEPARLFPVHRLDEETSGTLVVARDPDARRRLDRVFRTHDVERVYHAIVLGVPSPRRGTLEGRLAVRPGGVVVAVTRGGRRAVTHYATVATGAGFAVVACKLETGRRNQIRVQMADIGYPVAGDRKYGRAHPSFAAVRARRALLHATALAFAHPAGGGRVAAVAPFPDDFRALLGDDLVAQLSLEV